MSGPSSGPASRWRPRWLSRLLGLRAAPEAQSGECIDLDEDGVVRTWRDHEGRPYSQERWPWAQLRGFGFSIQEAVFPDPWFGPYVEAEWLLIVADEDGEQRLYLPQARLRLDRLPQPLRHLPGLDPEPLRHALREAGKGSRHFAGTGEWMAWRRQD